MSIKFKTIGTIALQHVCKCFSIHFFAISFDIGPFTFYVIFITTVIQVVCRKKRDKKCRLTSMAFVLMLLLLRSQVRAPNSRLTNENKMKRFKVEATQNAICCAVLIWDRDKVVDCDREYDQASWFSRQFQFNGNNKSHAFRHYFTHLIVFLLWECVLVVVDAIVVFFFFVNSFSLRGIIVYFVYLLFAFRQKIMWFRTTNY